MILKNARSSSVSRCHCILQDMVEVANETKGHTYTIYQRTPHSWYRHLLINKETLIVSRPIVTSTRFLETLIPPHIIPYSPNPHSSYVSLLLHDPSIHSAAHRIAHSFSSNHISSFPPPRNHRSLPGAALPSIKPENTKKYP